MKCDWEGQMKPMGLPLPGHIVTQIQFHIPGETAENSATIKDLKDEGVVWFLPHLPLILSGQGRE